MAEVRIGVDLGTCYSSVGYHDGQAIRYLKDPAAPQLSYSIPSSALLRRDGALVFGELAEREKGARPDCYQPQFKRDLGSSVPYELGELRVSPEELTAKFLRFLVEQVQETLSVTPGEAVVTVPASYDAHRKSVVKKAARTAGLPRVTMVPEPVAALVGAAEGVGVQLPKVGTVLVYDLGGGTFDAAVVRIEGGRPQVLGARGLPDFGGTDIDLLIEQDFGQQAANELGPLLAGLNSGDPLVRSRARRVRIRARDMCREIKHRLSSVEHASDELNLTISYELTRKQLEEMVRPHLDRTIATCRQLVADTGVGWEQISGILLVGGPCRMPAVRELVASQLGRPVWQAAEPELAVCTGAILLVHTPLDARRGVTDGRSGTPAEAGTASERYRQAIAGCWADGRLTQTEVDWLRDLGMNVLQLSPRTRNRIEREVLGDTLNQALTRQRETTAEHYQVALRLIRDPDMVAALKAIPRRRLDMLLGSVELFCNHDFPDCELRAEQRAALLGDHPWPAFVAAVRVAVNLDPAAPEAMSRLRELADELGLGPTEAAAAEKQELGRPADAFFHHQVTADAQATAREQERIKAAKRAAQHDQQHERQRKAAEQQRAAAERDSARRAAQERAESARLAEEQRLAERERAEAAAREQQESKARDRLWSLGTGEWTYLLEDKLRPDEEPVVALRCRLNTVWRDRTMLVVTTKRVLWVEKTYPPGHGSINAGELQKVDLIDASILFHRKDGTVTKFITWRTNQLPPVHTAAQKLL